MRDMKVDVRTYLLSMRIIELNARPGVHNAKAEECTTPYMRQNIEINIGVGGLHGNQGY